MAAPMVFQQLSYFGYRQKRGFGRNIIHVKRDHNLGLQSLCGFVHRNLGETNTSGVIAFATEEEWKRGRQCERCERILTLRIAKAKRGD